MRGLESELAAFLERASCRRLLAAFSGGLDSTVLAHLLARIASAQGLQVELGYFNHRLRGPESDAEEAFCVRSAARLGLPLHVGRWELPRPGEAAAREARYRWLGDLSTRRGL